MDSDSDTSSSGPDRLNVNDDGGWEDVEPDNEALTFVSLFNDTTFSDINEMLQYCQTRYDFDLAKSRRDMSTYCQSIVSL